MVLFHRPQLWFLSHSPPQSDQYLTAYTLPGLGSFAWSRAAMGLTGSPASFNRVLDAILSQVDNCLNYVDDILCFTKTPRDHLQTLCQVLEKLRKAGQRNQSFSRSPWIIWGPRSRLTGSHTLKKRRRKLHPCPLLTRCDSCKRLWECLITAVNSFSTMPRKSTPYNSSCERKLIGRGARFLLGHYSPFTGFGRN